MELDAVSHVFLYIIDGLVWLVKVKSCKVIAFQVSPKKTQSELVCSRCGRQEEEAGEGRLYFLDSDLFVICCYGFFRFE